MRHKEILKIFNYIKTYNYLLYKLNKSLFVQYSTIHHLGPIGQFNWELWISSQEKDQKQQLNLEIYKIIHSQKC